MQTRNHLLINAALDRPLRRHGINVQTPAFLTGAVLPDVPFPFNWSYRFSSPVSYWEGETGRIFTMLELALDAVLLIYLLRLWWRGRRIHNAK